MTLMSEFDVSVDLKLLVFSISC